MFVLRWIGTAIIVLAPTFTNAGGAVERYEQDKLNERTEESAKSQVLKYQTRLAQGMYADEMRLYWTKDKRLQHDIHVKKMSEHDGISVEIARQRVSDIERLRAKCEKYTLIDGEISGFQNSRGLFTFNIDDVCSSTLGRARTFRLIYSSNRSQWLIDRIVDEEFRK